MTEITILGDNGRNRSLLRGQQTGESPQTHEVGEGVVSQTECFEFRVTTDIKQRYQYSYGSKKKKHVFDGKKSIPSVALI